MSRSVVLPCHLTLLIFGIHFLLTGCATVLASPHWNPSELQEHLAEIEQQIEVVAKAPYAPPDRSLPQSLVDLDYDGYRKIVFDNSKSINLPPYQLQMFHRGYLFKDRVQIYLSSKYLPKDHPDKHKRFTELAYSPDLFEFLGKQPDHLHDVTGFAGLRLLYNLTPDTDRLDEVISFIGSSYFRALDRGGAYGSSARGLAVNIGLFDQPEEFPVFTRFWIIPRQITFENHYMIAALLESPSITGMYLFTLKPGSPTTVQVSMKLYPRKPIRKLGVAPLTSMFLYGEAGAKDNIHVDHRPEVHDADGLLIWQGQEHPIWHALENPHEHRITIFNGQNIASFGLMQRDKNVKHYNDFETNQHERPSIVVRSLHHSDDVPSLFESGHLELLEIASIDEGMDNIGAYWILPSPVQTGQKLEFAYELTFTHEQVKTREHYRVSRMSYQQSRPNTIDYAVTFEPTTDRIKDIDQHVKPTVNVDDKPVEAVKAERDPSTGVVTVTFTIKQQLTQSQLMRAQLLSSRGTPVGLSEIWSFTCPKAKSKP